MRLGVFSGFVRKDGLLRLAEPSDYRTRPCQLAWYIIDATTGQIVSSELRHFWTLDVSIQDFLFYAASHRAVAMTDEHSLVVMEADTMEEISRFRLVPHHAELHVNARCWLGQLAWSNDRRKPAATLENPAKRWDPRPLPPPPEMQRSNGHGDGASEVQIFDVASGQCLQFVLLRAVAALISWSSSLAMLSVYCDWEVLHPDSAHPAMMSGSQARGATIRVLEPAVHRADMVEREGLADQKQVWEACSWNPCGTFLLTPYQEDGSPDRVGIGLRDPHTLRHVFTASDVTRRISWGSEGSLHAEGRALHAFFAQHPICVKFWQEDGE